VGIPRQRGSVKRKKKAEFWGHSSPDRILSVMAHTWMGHVTHMNETCGKYERDVPHTCMSCGTHVNASCRASESLLPLGPQSHTRILVAVARVLQGGGNAWDALSCRSLSGKEPLIIGLFYGKRPIKIRHPTRHRHPVKTWGISGVGVRFDVGWQ